MLKMLILKNNFREKIAFALCEICSHRKEPYGTILNNILCARLAISTLCSK